jgi:hypothetical protein
MNDDDTDEVFVYMGEGGATVPRDVVHLRVDPSVTSIPACVFYECKKLAEVELCEGLVEIGDRSFGWCYQSIAKINFPNSLRRINDYAFSFSLQTPIRLHDDIESIGRGAFATCIFTNFRVPPLITVIPDAMLNSCRSMFSLELPTNISEIENYVFDHCYCLRNVAIPPNAAIGDAIFIAEDDDVMADLERLFGSDAEIIRELQHRFDRLPIHKLVYYQSYNQGVLQILIAAINMRSGLHRTSRSKLNPTGNEQDCLGMTPLHILACSSVHDLEMYRVIVENYPTNLITEDRWGALPLLYAFWGDAPSEIIQFLLASYKSLYPNHVFNWTMMVETMGRTDTQKENIENLLHVRQMHFPGQSIDWEYLLDKFATDHSRISFSGVPFQERMRYLITCCLSSRVEAIGLRVLRDRVREMIYATRFNEYDSNNRITAEIQDNLHHIENELRELKEITTILELALWKMRMNEESHNEKSTPRQKKGKTDESSVRQQCRVTCGANVVIGRVLPYLLMSTVDQESDSESNEDDDDDDESSDSE